MNFTPSQIIITLSLFIILLFFILSNREKSYEPDDFSWSGGSGRIEISCNKITEKNHKTYAEIVFDSPNYEYVKIDDDIYYAEHSGDTSTVMIPVELNKSIEIVGMTTAMSSPHEITYEITVYSGQKKDSEETPEENKDTENISENAEKRSPEIESLTYISSMNPVYAQEYNVYYYENGYQIIDIYKDARYLLVPEGEEAPEGLSEDIVVLKRPLNHIYLAATSAMALFDSLNCLDMISFTGTDISGWYIENAVSAMESGNIVFAGKYSEPDYELLLDGSCNLAVESTMILHSPKVKEMLEELGIPVFVDYSSYESHPLGRTEWIKLYGVIADKEEEAAAFFDEQAKVIEQLKDFKNTEKTVAFFYISTDGSVVVRRTDDYIPAMIEIAGGRYIFDNLENTAGKSSSVNLSMEEFYAAAVDADYLIYNSSIDNPLNDMGDLLDKSELFADFKAVKNGNVWCTGKYLYQATDIVGNLIQDIHFMITDENEENMTFLYRVK